LADEVPRVCIRLRSKGAGVIYGEPVTWENGFYPNATFWCLATADALGPDDGFVHPHACTTSRACCLTGGVRSADRMESPRTTPLTD
jgi:hypothetical protein